MANRNPDGSPNGVALREDGAIPYLSQIVNNSDAEGVSAADALNTVNLTRRLKVEGLSIETLNNEQTVAIGGSASDQFCPTLAIVHMRDVGEGDAANGDVAITIGITAGGTQILAAKVCTNLIAVNTKFIIDLSAIVKPSIPANSTIYVKVTTADTTAGAGHLADVYITGQTIQL